MGQLRATTFNSFTERGSWCFSKNLTLSGYVVPFSSSSERMLTLSQDGLSSTFFFSEYFWEMRGLWRCFLSLAVLHIFHHGVLDLSLKYVRKKLDVFCWPRLWFISTVLELLVGSFSSWLLQMSSLVFFSSGPPVCPSVHFCQVWDPKAYRARGPMTVAVMSAFSIIRETKVDYYKKTRRNV